MTTDTRTHPTPDIRHPGGGHVIESLGPNGRFGLNHGKWGDSGLPQTWDERFFYDFGAEQSIPKREPPELNQSQTRKTVD